ncbi:MAG: hypothetical protein QOH82_4417 [Mycobacterium sp.]|nr:hypothetical protein [Mycobacterium sp.]
MTFDGDLTGLLVIDPYNDFISEGGKVSSRGLRNLEIRGTDPEGGMRPQDLRRRNLGR